MAMIDIFRQHYFPRSEITSRDRKISGYHTKLYACLMVEKSNCQEIVQNQSLVLKTKIVTQKARGITYVTKDGFSDESFPIIFLLCCCYK